MDNIFIGLIHYPVKQGDTVITSSITNLDIHDISRVSASYGLGGYYIIHPDESQRRIAGDLAGHWLEGAGKKYNPDRNEAFKKLHIVKDIKEACEEIKQKTGMLPVIVGTSARKNAKSVAMKELEKHKKNPLLILFGTAGGLSEQLDDIIEFYIEPIDAATGYNHLSVRSAVSIFIDRLFMCVYH